MATANADMTKEYAKVLKAWQRAVAKCHEMLAAIDRAEAVEGSDWARGMRRHWQGRLDRLQADKPRPATRRG